MKKKRIKEEDEILDCNVGCAFSLDGKLDFRVSCTNSIRDIAFAICGFEIIRS